MRTFLFIFLNWGFISGAFLVPFLVKWKIEYLGFPDGHTTAYDEAFRITGSIFIGLSFFWLVYFLYLSWLGLDRDRRWIIVILAYGIFAITGITGGGFIDILIYVAAVFSLLSGSIFIFLSRNGLNQDIEKPLIQSGLLYLGLVIIPFYLADSILYLNLDHGQGG